MPESQDNVSTEPSAFTLKGKPLTCGVRFSALDAVFLLVGTAATVWIWRIHSEFALLIPFLLFHFFLFCNVFRVARASELVWSGVFIVVFSLGSASSYVVNWPAICAIQLPLTAFLLWRETRQPWYHGMACRKWNAEHIDAYLRGEMSHRL